VTAKKSDLGSWQTADYKRKNRSVLGADPTSSTAFTPVRKQPRLVPSFNSKLNSTAPTLSGNISDSDSVAIVQSAVSSRSPLRPAWDIDTLSATNEQSIHTNLGSGNAMNNNSPLMAHNTDNDNKNFTVINNTDVCYNFTTTPTSKNIQQQPYFTDQYSSYFSNEYNGLFCIIAEHTVPKIVTDHWHPFKYTNIFSSTFSGICNIKPIGHKKLKSHSIPKLWQTNDTLPCFFKTLALLHIFHQY